MTGGVGEERAGRGAAWPLFSRRVAVAGRGLDELAGARGEGLPARPGVLVFEAAGDGPVGGSGGGSDGLAGGFAAAVLATGDLRAAALRRLVPERQGGGAAVCLRPVTTAVHAAVTGGSAEADVVYLETARALAPRTYRAATDRWRGWFLRLDPDEPHPHWRPTDLSDAERLGGEATLLGPMGTKDAAKKYGRLLDELFSLCREPALLAQRPGATACSYKEMGSCPAPCDGSEPIGSFRERVRRAVAFASGWAGGGVGGGAMSEAARNEVAMREAAAAHDFERAAELRARGETLSAMSTPALRRVTTLDRWQAALVGPAGRAGWARVIAACGFGGLWWLADVDARAGGWEAAVVARLGDVFGRRWSGERGPDADGLARARGERVGLLCQRAFRPGRSKATAVVMVDRAALAEAGEADESGERGGPVGAELLRAARRAAKIEAEPAAAGGAGEHESAG